MAVVTVAEAKAHLNITSTAHDAELATIIPAAESVIAQRVGPLEPTTVTSSVAGHSGTLILPTSPVISLTTVTPVGGTALTVADLTLDGTAGLVTYTSGAAFGARRYTVVYSAGRAAGALPADLRFAVLELVRHLWQSQRGPGNRPGSSAIETASAPGAAYLLPYRVEALIAPHQQIGVA